MTNLFIIYLILVILLSIVTYFAYAFDKRKAIKGSWRTKEKTLLLMSFLFGALGGTIAMYTKRHKNKHWYFVLVNISSLIIHLLLGYFLFGKEFNGLF